MNPKRHSSDRSDVTRSRLSLAGARAATSARSARAARARTTARTTTHRSMTSSHFYRGPLASATTAGCLLRVAARVANAHAVRREIVFQYKGQIVHPLAPGQGQNEGASLPSAAAPSSSGRARRRRRRRCRPASQSDSAQIDPSEEESFQNGRYLIWAVSPSTRAPHHPRPPWTLPSGRGRTHGGHRATPTPKPRVAISRPRRF